VIGSELRTARPNCVRKPQSRSQLSRAALEQGINESEALPSLSLLANHLIDASTHSVSPRVVLRADRIELVVEVRGYPRI